MISLIKFFLVTSSVVSHVAVLLLLLIARGSVRGGGGADDKQHLLDHLSPRVHVCCYWSTTIQGPPLRPP